MTNLNLKNNSPFETGMNHHETGDLIKAELFYKKAILQSDSTAKAKNYLGMVYYAKGNLLLATDTWNESSMADSGYIDPLVNLALAHSQIQAFDKALEYFNLAIRVDPSRQDLIQQAAQLSAQLGNINQAAALLEPTFRIKPPNPNMFLLLAQIYAESGDSKASEDVLHRLLKVSPGLPEGLINLGHLNVDRGEITKAKNYFLDVLKKHPEHFIANLEGGKCLSNNGEPERGLKLLKKAASLQPNDFSVHIHQGNVLQQLGLFEDAVDCFKKAVELNPENLGAKQSLSRVLTRFVPPWHLKMLADHERNNAFEKAIAKAVNPDSVVLDIGAGSGLLSMMAAKHGAKRVFACEQSSHISEVAKKIVEKNGFKDRVKLFNLKSTQLTKNELKEKPNLIVAEIFDAGLIGEMAIPTFRHALKELCSEECKIIPAKAQVMGRLLHAPSSSSVNPMKNISGFDLSHFDQFRVPQEYISEDLKLSEHQFLSNEFDMLDFNFTNLGDPISDNSFKSKELEVLVNDSGVLHGVAFWFNLLLDDEIELSSKPDRLNNHWGQALFFFEQNLKVKKGDLMELNMRFNDISIWFEEPNLIKKKS